MCNDTVKTNPLDNSIGMNLTSKMKDEFIFNCWQGNYYLLERVMGESDEHKKKKNNSIALQGRKGSKNLQTKDSVNSVIWDK